MRRRKKNHRTRKMDNRRTVYTGVPCLLYWLIIHRCSTGGGLSARNKRILIWFWFDMEYLCRPSEASTRFCVIPSGYPPQDGQSLLCAGEELDSNPGLLICSQVRYHWATFPPPIEPPLLLALSHLSSSAYCLANKYILLFSISSVHGGSSGMRMCMWNNLDTLQ